MKRWRGSHLIFIVRIMAFTKRKFSSRRRTSRRVRRTRPKRTKGTTMRTKVKKAIKSLAEGKVHCSVTFSTNDAGTPTSTNTIQYLLGAGIDQGVAGNQRIGNKIFIKYIEVEFNVMNLENSTKHGVVTLADQSSRMYARLHVLKDNRKGKQSTAPLAQYFMGNDRKTPLNITSISPGHNRKKQPIHPLLQTIYKRDKVLGPTSQNISAANQGSTYLWSQIIKIPINKTITYEANTTSETATNVELLYPNIYTFLITDDYVVSTNVMDYQNKADMCVRCFYTDV